MIKHHFFQIEGLVTFITLTQKDGTKNDIVPNPQNGWLGVIHIGEKITITAVVTKPHHECFSLDTNMVKTLKKSIGEGTYEKSVKVVENPAHPKKGMIAHWPGNMMCLVIDGKNFNLGIYEQNGYFFFVIEEFIPDEKKEYRPNEVRWFSLLRGFGAVASENEIFDYRLYFLNIPRRKVNQLRFVDSGELIKIINSKNLVNKKTQFIAEITEMTVD